MHCCHRIEPGSQAATLPRVHTASLASATWIGVVVDPDDAGQSAEENQILVEFSTNEESSKPVFAELSRGLSVVPGDRVLFVMPANSPLAVITSVLSPASQNATCQTALMAAETSSRLPTAQELVLRDSESLCVMTSTGQTLVAIERGACGPIVRLGEGSLELDMPGELHLMADSLRFTTRSGPISIQSQSDDVIVQGRVIHLN